jgi:hypothetical protein
MGQRGDGLGYAVAAGGAGTQSWLWHVCCCAARGWIHAGGQRPGADGGFGRHWRDCERVIYSRVCAQRAARHTGDLRGPCRASWLVLVASLTRARECVADETEDEAQAEAAGFKPVPADLRTDRKARIPLQDGACNIIRLAPAASRASYPSVFPAPVYPAALVRVDRITAGSWIGTYGGAGYSLFAYDGINQRVEALPPFVASITQSFSRAQNGPWPTNGSDPRALQDPRPSTARKIGQYSVPLPWDAGWDPSFVLDIYLQPWAEGNTTYRFAVYCVDFDFKGRRQTVTLMDRQTLNPISPPQYLDEFTGGVWLVWEYSRSVRLRFNYIRGDNQVVSAIVFDV